ncbi:serine hydrolase domain-containing protein [Nannocystaceae bacterium ST9]
MRSSIRCSALALVVLACTSEPPPELAESTPAPETPTPPESPESPEAARKRECIDRLLPAAEPRFHGLLRSVCAEWVNQAIPGVAIAVVERGELRLHAELGVRCLGRAEPVEPSTAFRVGSISKTFTAALVLDALDPDALAEPVALAGLEWPAGLPAPSPHALLVHRSGLGEIAPDRVVAFAGDWKSALAHSPAFGPPGEWHYSNAGYVILGALLESKTARSYEELLHARFARLSTITSDPTKSSEPACGHLPEPGGLRVIPVDHDLDFMPGDPSWLRPTGGVLSSAEDLARFGAGLDPRMFEPGEPLPREVGRHDDERYGSGLRSWTRRDGEWTYGHSGDTGTFAAELIVAPDRQIAIVLLANAPTQWSGPRLAVDELLNRL